MKLNILKETIGINLSNYIFLTETLKKKAGYQSDLSFLEDFSNLTETKYLKQIEKDEATMKLGLQLLESNINALRGQIELEKSERDRNFQNLVAIIGGGTAIISLFDFEGKKCQTIANNWPFYQNKDNTPPTEQKQELEVIYPCNNYIFGGIITPLLLFSLVCLVCIFILNFKGIIQKFKL